jgi:RNA polymerase sigma-70 factor (ECF subfamily)
MSQNSNTPVDPAFAQQLAMSQSALYCYIVSLLGGVDEASDVLQETNFKLCREAAQYDPLQPFLRWAYTFAKFEVLAAVKRRRRSKLVLDEATVELLAAEYEQAELVADKRLAALEKCLQRLSQNQRDLLAARYEHGQSLQEISEKLAMSDNSLAAMFYRLRKMLADCIEKRLRLEAR